VPKAAGTAAAPKNVINLMDALRRSVESGKTSKPAAERPAAKPAKKGKKRIDGQREMLLPIAGKKKDAAKEVGKPAARRKAS
jgi:DNA end-binding protein Ku